MKSKIKLPPQDKAVITVAYVIVGLLAILCVLPFLSVIAKAFSGYTANVSGAVGIIPIDFQTKTFVGIINSSKFLRSFGVSAFVAVVGTALSVVVSGMAAYALSQKQIKYRSFFTVVFVFTMMFSAGLVPSYILMRTLKLLNTIWVLFVPGAISVYNMLIMKSSFESVPAEVTESAKIDGARNLTIFFKIMLPISLPTIAAVSLFLIVGYWNEYWSAMLYITDNDLKPLQIYLLDVINSASSMTDNIELAMETENSTEGTRAATILASTIPILIIYPFMQKFFVKGVMVGSVKG